MPEDSGLQARLGSIEELLHRIEAAADPSLLANVRQLVELVMSLHGEGLERVMEIVRGRGEPGEALVEKIGEDDLLGSLLVLHGLHPLSLEARVTRAVEKTRARLRPYDAELDILGIEAGNVRLWFSVKAGGCGSTGENLKRTVEEEIYRAAPDIGSLTIEGPEATQGFVPLEMLASAQPVPAGKGAL